MHARARTRTRASVYKRRDARVAKPIDILTVFAYSYTTTYTLALLRVANNALSWTKTYIILALERDALLRAVGWLLY